MTSSSEPREPASGLEHASIPEQADDWLRQFVRHLELHFIDTSSALPVNVSLRDLQKATLWAVFQTLRDSSSEIDDTAIVEMVGQVLMERKLPAVQWSPSLNQRRFELIDKEIQSTITLAEQIELAGLTHLMRAQLESEEALPLEGARMLHKRLLDLE